jgi:protein gp37
MSDLFHEGVADEYIQRVVDVMMAAPQHTYQVLTKRATRMRELLNSKLAFVAREPNIWWGVSVEDKKYGLPRIAELQKAKVSVRFLSIEPLLEGVGTLNLSGIDWIIVGGESGHHARPFNLDWGRSILRQCHDQKLPCFIKQLGRNPVENGAALRLTDRKGGDWKEWPSDLRVRQYPTISTNKVCIDNSAEQETVWQ